MSKPSILILAFLLSASPAAAQRSTPGTQAELDEITSRGRLIAEYDQAAWHSTDAVQAARPQKGSINGYVGRKTEKGWTVVFGRLNEQKDAFHIAFEAVQGATPEEFTVSKFDAPKTDSGFYLFAAKALDLGIADFKGENRPYNVAVLPSKTGQFYVYVLPAQTENGTYPHGGDFRYLVSGDGSKIVDKRRMHNSIIEFKVTKDIRPEMGYHTAVVDDIPEDTDVFLVLSRRPLIPEMIATRHYIYQIKLDGTIKYLMTVEAFSKIKDKQE